MRRNVYYGRYGRFRRKRAGIPPALGYTVLILALIALDQGVKGYFISLKRDFDVPVLGNLLHFTYVKNSGAAFGMFQNSQLLLIGVTAIMICVCVLLLVSRYFRETLANVSLALIIAGGVGNLIDRVFRHFVVDFIYVKIIDFPVFNIADSCVCIGTLLLCIYFIRKEMQDSRKRMFRRYGR